ncbi:hypothetical protein MHU86_17434 [Fragilaria crotonensis]|nr:hypothetical protein MHU86_17434 [Fragilaria crotonensis]
MDRGSMSTVQLNLNFSSWLCLLVCAWTMERWLVSCDYPVLDGVLASWPKSCSKMDSRLPSIISGTRLSILDLYFNWDKVDTAYINAEYKSVPPQWEWLIFARGFTMLPSIGFDRNAYLFVWSSSLWIPVCGGFKIGDDEFLQSSRIRRGHTGAYNTIYWSAAKTENMEQQQTAMCDDGDSGSLNSIRWKVSPFQI